MGIKISQMTDRVTATGIELLPASVSDAPRRVSVEQVKDFTLAAAAAITPASGVSSGNGVFILQGSELKPVDIDAVTQRAVDIVWGKAAEVTPAGSGVVPLKEGSAEKTVTLANLATYIQGVIRAAVLNPATLDAAGSTSAADVFILGQSGVAKKISLSDVQAAVLAGLKDFVAGLTVVTSAADADELYVIQGGVSRKITYAKLKEGIGLSGYVTAPAGTVENKVPQWDAVAKKLKEGLAVRADVRASGSTDDSLVNETAVRDLVGGLDDFSAMTGKVDVSGGDLIPLSDSADEHKQKVVLAENLRAYMLGGAGGLELGTTETTAHRGDHGAAAYTHSQAAHAPADAVALGETETTAHRGDHGAAAYTHSQAAHAPADAQKNSDITKAEIEAKLTGEIASHTHAEVGTTGYAGFTEHLGSFAISAGSAGHLIEVSSTGTPTATVNRADLLDVPIGSFWEVYCSGTGGSVTITEGSDTVLHYKTGTKTDGIFNPVRVIKLNNNSFMAFLVVNGVA